MLEPTPNVEFEDACNAVVPCFGSCEKQGKYVSFRSHRPKTILHNLPGLEQYLLDRDVLDQWKHGDVRFQETQIAAFRLWVKIHKQEFENDLVDMSFLQWRQLPSEERLQILQEFQNIKIGSDAFRYSEITGSSWDDYIAFTYENIEQDTRFKWPILGYVTVVDNFGEGNGTLLKVEEYYRELDLRFQRLEDHFEGQTAITDNGARFLEDINIQIKAAILGAAPIPLHVRSHCSGGALYGLIVQESNSTTLAEMRNDEYIWELALESLPILLKKIHSNNIEQGAVTHIGISSSEDSRGVMTSFNFYNWTRSRIHANRRSKLWCLPDMAKLIHTCHHHYFKHHRNKSERKAFIETLIDNLLIVNKQVVEIRMFLQKWKNELATDEKLLDEMDSWQDSVVTSQSFRQNSLRTFYHSSRNVRPAFANSDAVCKGRVSLRDCLKHLQTQIEQLPQTMRETVL